MLADDFPRRALIEDLARRLGRHPAVERVWLFGSRARGDNFERSDIDLAVEAPGIDRGEWAALHLDLDEEADTLLLIDFVLVDDLPESFRQRVQREGRLLYERRNPDGIVGELGQRPRPLRGGPRAP
jgi:predicted nucleotidyltransferase